MELRAVFIPIIACAGISALSCSNREAVAGVVDETMTPNSGEFIAQCITQDWEFVFPMFWHSSSGAEESTFSTYSGISVTILDVGERRRITTRSPRPLTAKQIAYIHKCGSQVWWGKGPEPR